jgi:Fe(3+) dicitrate transport protein
MAKRITHTHRLLAWAVLSTITTSEAVFQALHAAEFNTNVPKASEAGGFPVQINLPAQPLNQSIRQLANQTGLSISFDSELTKNKTAPAVKGFLSPQEALKKVLQGSGLELNMSGDSAVIKPEPEKTSQSLKLDAVEVRAKRFYEVGPLPGLGLTKEEIPGNVQSITAKQIKESHALSIADLMNTQLQSVNVNDYQGNPFQMDVTYRGFTASPQIGTPQGLSVFLDGIRVNEPFGDVVNWDMIPMNALAGVDVFPGSNPIFGLGTLGGAFSMKTKDGFSHEGVDAEVLTGSFGRKQLQISSGWNNGTVGVFGAGNFFLEDGWRENSPSKVNQVFAKASYRGEKLDLNFSTLLVRNDLVGNGLVPNQQYQENRNGVYTSPDTTKNDLMQFQLSGSYFVDDHFTITAQAYRRESDRNSLGADVYTEGYEGENARLRRNLNPGEQYTCLYTSTNSYGIPDYYVLTAPTGNPFDTDFIQTFFNDGTIDYSQLVENEELDPVYAKFVQDQLKFFQNIYKTAQFQSDTTAFPTPIAPPNSAFDAISMTQYKGTIGDVDPIQALAATYFYTLPTATTLSDGTVLPAGTQKILLIKTPVNGDVCTGGTNTGGNTGGDLVVLDGNGKPLIIDGANDVNGTGPGVVNGIPTGVLTRNRIKQVTDGASIQLNWNYEKHKFMIGASIDSPSASYENSQRLGLIDAKRSVFLAPDQIQDQFAAADNDIQNNNFSGNGVTKSLYASETWSPTETLHFSGSARYNMTRIKNKVAVRQLGSSGFDLANYLSFPDFYNYIIDGVVPTTGFHTIDTSGLLNKPETEKFSYYSLNPSLGVSWQATENFNIYSNWAQGTRTPSVVELGCAFDRTLVPNGNGGTIEKSIQENRSCSLPTTLAGDPYLPQIKAQTIDVGMRGKWGSNVEWNVGAYRTDLRDDIYLVTFPGNRSFFDSIGDTRRQGLEAGITAIMGKARLKLNYALTDATFQNTFKISGQGNSSAVFDDPNNTDELTSRITVRPGDRMPGVPLHNLNATLSYEITPKWQASLTAIAHSMSYLRGNENNKHRAGVTTFVNTVVPNGNGGNDLVRVARTPTNNPGSIDGYVTFNFRTSYQLSKEWQLGMLINNVLDKEYFSAGRLGVNPFSPSINGAIGPDGYNHNSNDWLANNFLAPGAPRGIWFSLNWHFVPD